MRALFARVKSIDSGQETLPTAWGPTAATPSANRSVIRKTAASWGLGKMEVAHVSGSGPLSAPGPGMLLPGEIGLPCSSTRAKHELWNMRWTPTWTPDAWNDMAAGFM